jgi:Icc-related predicted phosphoesterase
MKILLCSDLGGKIPAIPKEMIDQCQFVLLAGDVTMGAKAEARAEKNFNALAELFPPSLPVYYIPGNHDYAYIADAEKYAWIPKNFISMHNRFIKIDIPSFPRPIVIIGFGGAKLGLYNNFAFSEDEIYNSLAALFDKSSSDRLNTFTILLSHDPPFNSALDFNFQKNHVGSESVRKIIEQYHPQLCVAGHIHESPGQEKIGSTFAINAGEAKFDRYAIITIDMVDGSLEEYLISADFLFPAKN